MARVQFSAVLITLNEEHNLEACLKALSQVTDDIVIIDGDSVDKTADIAKKYQAQFIKHEWLGYAQTKNLGHQYAKHDWILSIDADEVLSSALIKKLQTLRLQKDTVYLLDRMTNFCGQWIKHCGWYPDWKLRLFHKDQARWEGDYVHETLVPDTDCEKIKLDGVLEHYSYKSHQDHLDRNAKYAKLAAKEWVAKGRKIGLLKRWFAPSFRFFKTYILRLGFLDGQAGCVISKHDAILVKRKMEYYDELKRG